MNGSISRSQDGAYNSPRRPAFTLVELLVVIAIIALLIGMLFPALSAVRESARRTQCGNRMTQLGLAAQEYQLAFDAFPAGVLSTEGPVLNEPHGIDQSWTIPLLPYLDESAAVRDVVPDVSIYDQRFAEKRQHAVVALLCPSATGVVSAKPAVSCYAGVHHDVEAPIDADNHGVLFLNSAITTADIIDGSRYTLMFGEKTIGPADLGWMSGTRATLRNTGSLLNTDAPSGATEDPAYVGGFGSAHVAVVGVVFADGSQRFLSEDIEPTVLRQLGHRADGTVVSPARVW
jgi:prepilin-type N-terminal cleavage/methylation domain-containing protein